MVHAEAKGELDAARAAFVRIDHGTMEAATALAQLRQALETPFLPYVARPFFPHLRIEFDLFLREFNSIFFFARHSRARFSHMSHTPFSPHLRIEFDFFSREALESPFLPYVAHPLFPTSQNAIRSFLRQALEQAIGEQSLVELEELCAHMAEGWCAWVLETMQTSLRTMLELERYDALDACGPSSSLVDLFTQLDSIAGVYVAFAAPQSLPPTMHQQLLDLIETQASQYAFFLYNGYSVPDRTGTSTGLPTPSCVFFAPPSRP